LQRRELDLFLEGAEPLIGEQGERVVQPSPDLARRLGEADPVSFRGRAEIVEHPLEQPDSQRQEQLAGHGVLLARKALVAEEEGCESLGDLVCFGVNAVLGGAR